MSKRVTASREAALRQHQARLARCRRCPAMLGQPVIAQPVLSAVILVGQAPGSKEIVLHRPFAWTAGKTMFAWFREIGLAEAEFRQRVYMAAVCRCFPGKNPAGGDRVPSPQEISNCSSWLEAEIELLRPELIIPVGKLAIGRFVAVKKLDEVVGRRHVVTLGGRAVDLIPLPHPSGASVWHRVEPGKTFLNLALTEISTHPAWQSLLPASSAPEASG